MKILTVRKERAKCDKKFGLNQFARMLDISPAHLSRIEHGKKKPTSGLAIKACSLLGIESDSVLAEFNLLPPDIKDILVTHKHRALYYNLIRCLDSETPKTFTMLLKLIEDGEF
jgi:transcriptional regulator with XRE-family HTH domain